jgi:FkbM family methyltransferase
LFWRAGLDVRPYRAAVALNLHRQEVLRNVTVALDIGANSGQWGSELRAWGYRGRIISFEPLSAAYRGLARRSAADARWDAYNYALGDRDGTADINVAGNSQSSSILRMQQRHRDALPSSGYVGTETVRVERLDDLKQALGVTISDVVYLKIDVQGFELVVLQNAQSWFTDKLVGIELELSLVPLYEGGPLMGDVIGWLRGHGYILTSVQSGWDDQKSGEILQMDGLFTRLPNVPRR